MGNQSQLEVDYGTFLSFFSDTVKRTDSIQSRRKVSSLSDRSDTSDQGGEESPGILSDDQPPESPSDSNDTDETAKQMPWMKSILDLMNSFNYYCNHQNFCHPYCYRRHMRAASRLLRAVRKVSEGEGERGAGECGCYWPASHPMPL